MSSAKKSGLGKGLTALLADSNTDITGKNAVPVNAVSEIALNEIEANPFQPREEFAEDALRELMQSIKEHGIIQPITVRKVGYGKYQIISGERRVRASIRAGLKSVPAYVRVANDQEMLEMALVENIQRRNLNPMEIAISYQRLQEECNLKQEELAQRVGKDRATVSNYLRLIKLPDDIKAALRDNIISMGHARAIINVPDPKDQSAIYKQIISKGLSVRQVEKLVKELKEGKPVKRTPDQGEKGDFETWRYQIWERRLTKVTNRKVKVKTQKGEKGEIVIPFTSEEDLQRLTEMFGEE